MVRKTTAWNRNIKESADPRRAWRILELFEAADPELNLKHCSADEARVLAALFGGSEALSNLVLAHPKWLGLLTPDQLAFSRRKQGLANELASLLESPLMAREY